MRTAGRTARTFLVGTAVAATLALGACSGGGGAGRGAEAATTTHPVDVKAACGALGDLRHSGDLLTGVDVSDPAGSAAALARAVNAYLGSLARFEAAAPAALGPPADRVRAAVIAHRFADAQRARAAIDTWSAAHCSPS